MPKRALYDYARTVVRRHPFRWHLAFVPWVVRAYENATHAEATADLLAAHAAGRIELLPAFTSNNFSPEELAVLHILYTTRPSYRYGVFAAAGLGDYRIDNVHIRSLAEKRVVSVAGGMKVTLLKERARRVLSQHEAPVKYRGYLENTVLTFAPSVVNREDAALCPVIDGQVMWWVRVKE